MICSSVGTEGSDAIVPLEVQVIANIARRAMARPESPIFLPGQTQGRTNQEILTGANKPENKPE